MTGLNRHAIALRVRGPLGMIRRNLLVALLLACAIGLTWMVKDVMERNTRRAADAAAIEHETILARLLLSEWSHVLADVQGLDEIAAIISRQMLAHQDTSTAMLQLQARIATAGPDVVQVAAIGADGILLWSSLPLGPKPVDLSARPHFRAIAVDGLDTFAGSPVVGKVSGQTTIQMAAAVRRPDRTLQAVTVVSIDAAIARKLAAVIGLSGRGSISIYRTDGTLLAASEASANKVLPPLRQPALQRVLAQGHAEGRHRSASSGIDRYYARVRVPGTDMIVSVGLDVDRELATMRVALSEIRWLEGELDGVLVVLSGVVVAALEHLRRSRRERLRSLVAFERQQLLRDLADEATDIISIHDSEFRYLYVNQAIVPVVGHVPPVGTTGWLRVVPEDRAALDVAVAALQQGAPARRVTFRVQRSDGGLCWLESEIIRLAPAAGDDSRGPIYFGISRDVTQRKIVEESLLEAQSNLEAMLHGSGGVIYRVHEAPDGTHVTKAVGAAQCRYFGYPPEAFTHPSFLPGLLEPDSRMAWNRLREVCLAQGQGVIEVQLRQGSGTWCWARVEAYRFAPAGQAADLLYFIADITDERRLRAQTERLAALGEVSASISHELNQPLATIAMAARNGQVAQQSQPEEPAKVAARFARIEKQVQRATGIISHITDFARRDHEIRELLDVRDVITDAVVLAQSRLGKVGAGVRVDVVPGLPPLRAVRLLLEQVLLNLLINAADAYADSPDDADARLPRSVTVRVERDRDVCVIRVTDQAGGIAPALLDDIFKPFFTTKPSGKGTGLGLAFCRTAVAQLHGQIAARNKGDGAEFEVRVPGLVNAAHAEARERDGI